MKIIVTAKSEEFESQAQIMEKAMNYLADKIELEKIVTQEVRKQYMNECFKSGIVRCKR